MGAPLSARGAALAEFIGVMLFRIGGLAGGSRCSTNEHFQALRLGAGISGALNRRLASRWADRSRRRNAAPGIAFPTMIAAMLRHHAAGAILLRRSMVMLDKLERDVENHEGRPP